MTEENEFKDRLKRAIEESGLSVRAIAEAVDCAEGTIRKYLRADTEPNLSMLIELAKLLEVDFTWLSIGNGSPAGEWDKNFFSIPYLEEYFFGPSQRPAHKVFREIVQGLHFSENAFRAMIGQRPEGMRLLVMDGDSMAPYIWNGNLLVISTTCSEVEPGMVKDLCMPKEGVYAVRIGGNVTVRRLQPDPEGARIFFLPENSSYQTFEVKREGVHCCSPGPPAEALQIVIIGRVVWVSHRI